MIDSVLGAGVGPRPKVDVRDWKDHNKPTPPSAQFFYPPDQRSWENGCKQGNCPAMA